MNAVAIIRATTNAGAAATAMAPYRTGGRP